MQNINKLTFKAEAPSNIALVKYWGKREVQLPINPSLSMTLKSAKTISTWAIDPSDNFELKLYLDNQRFESFEKKVLDWFNKLESKFNFIFKYKHTIHTQNTFPHSAGIASSASAFASLAMCLSEFYYSKTDKKLSLSEISSLARLGSGSASRSLEGPFCEWGDHSLDSAHVVEDIAPVYMSLKDAILVVDDRPKKLSSTMGHKLMQEHRYKETRIESANKNFKDLKCVLKNGDLTSFIQIVEDEAMSLHALMMTSSPAYTLLKPNTLKLIELIKEFREEKNIKLCFTLDAGPNIHLLYFEDDANLVESFLNSKCREYLCSDIIWDDNGRGASLIND